MNPKHLEHLTHARADYLTDQQNEKVLLLTSRKYNSMIILNIENMLILRQVHCSMDLAPHYLRRITEKSTFECDI